MFRNQKGQFSSLKVVAKWFGVRYIVLFCLFTSLLVIVAYVAHINAPVKVVEKTLIVEAPKQLPPVLQRIAQCESGNMHTKNGKLVVRVNKDGSQDVGILQINITYWGLQAMKLGYNLTLEKDNIAMGVWLFENRGTEPWIHSKACWNK